MNAKKLDSSLCNLTYLVDNAQGLAKALYELTLCDDLINPEDIASRDDERKMKVWELLRLHGASSRLVCMLSDTLDSIEKEIDALEDATLGDTIAENLNGIQDTETATPKKCAYTRKA